MEFLRLFNPISRSASREHVEDALDHASDQCPNLKIVSKENRVLSVRDLSQFDDLSSWPEWRQGEFVDLEEDEIHDELVSFRGSGFARAAEGWINGEPMPPIVVVVTPEDSFVGDGRGRSSVAIAANLPIPATILHVECEDEND